MVSSHYSTEEVDKLIQDINAQVTAKVDEGLAKVAEERQKIQSQIDDILSRLKTDSRKCKLYVPLYHGVASDSGAWATEGRRQWSAVIEAKKRFPDVGFIVAINPASGVGSQFNATYQGWVKSLKDVGCIVIGYIPTGWGRNALSNVKDQIDKYIEWYSVDGLMLDEMSSSSTHIPYYTEITDYAKSKGLKYVKGNPGVLVPEDMINCVDNVAIYENAGYPDYQNWPAWFTKYSPDKYSIVAYNIQTLDKTKILEIAKRVGVIYITPDILPNPYDTIPSNLESLCEILSMQ